MKNSPVSKIWDFFLEDWLGLCLGPAGVSSIDGFTARLSKQWHQWQQHRQSFSSFWLFCHLLQLWEGNLFGCMTFSYSHRHFPPTILFPGDFFLQPWQERRRNQVPSSQFWLFGVGVCKVLEPALVG
jgi:hypothetical protein